MLPCLGPERALKTRRWEAFLGESQQATDPTNGSTSSAQPTASTTETKPTEKQVRLLPGLELIPSTSPPKRARKSASTLKGPKGWRLAAAHWIGLGLLVMVMVVSLLQASPLHVAQRVMYAFQTGNVGSFLVPPTPTPTPTPTPKPAPPPPPPGSAAVVSIIDSVFGSYSNAAIAIATCESSLNPSAVNPTAIGNSHATGLFQILYPSTWDTTSYAGNSPYDAQANADAAYEIFKRDGYSWREWQCQP